MKRAYGGLLATVAVLVCCCGEEPRSDGDAAAGFDGGRVDSGSSDAEMMRDSGNDDAAIDGSHSHRDAGRLLDFTLEVHDSTACAAWSPTPNALTRGLPPDSSPRQLWSWSAELDPVVVDSGVLGFVVSSQIAVALDGSLRFVLGSAYDHVAALDRSGSARWVVRTGVMRSGPIVAPSGESFVFDESRRLIAIGNDGETAVVGNVPDAADVWLATGPEGRLYIVSRRAITATCAGRRRVWTLSFPDAFDAGEPLVVADDGSMFVRDQNPAAGGAAIQISSNGAVVQRFSAFDGIASEGATWLTVSGDTRMFCGFADPGRERADFCDVAWAGSSTRWRVPLAGSPGAGAVLDPTGAVWVQDRISPTHVTLERYESPARLWRTSGRGFPLVGFTWTSDGSLLGQANGEEDSTALELIAADTGTPRWSIQPTAPDGRTFEFLSLGLDISGRAYVASDRGEIAAFQTDVLPPTSGSCATQGCDGRRSRSMTDRL